MNHPSLSERVEPVGVDAAAPHLRIGEILVQSGKVSARDIDRALLAQQEMGSMLGRVLVRLGLVSD
ncbi:MAG: type II secretion system protein GspE, partial [Alcaligenaceae bacterium]